MTISIARGWRIVSLDDAKAAVAGYAFAVREVGGEQAPRWAYQTYDCVLASPGPNFSDLDILIAASLNGSLNVAAIGALRLAVNRAGPNLLGSRPFPSPADTLVCASSRT